MNHFISAVCCSLLSVDGWNSLSTHFFASASPAQAPCPSVSAAAANATACMRNLIMVSSEFFPCVDGRAGWEGGAGILVENTSALAQDGCEHEHRNDEADPDRGLGVEAEPADHLFADGDERQ